MITVYFLLPDPCTVRSTYHTAEGTKEFCLIAGARKTKHNSLADCVAVDPDYNLLEFDSKDEFDFVRNMTDW